MIIFLYGADTYRSRQKLNEIIGYYKKVHKSGLNLKYFDFGKNDFREFQDEIKSNPMFKEKKLVVLRNTFLNENFKINFLKNSKKIVDSSDIFLFHEEAKIPNDELFKFLKKYGKSQEFKPLKGQRLKIWIRKEFENYQTKITPEALEVFLDFVGNDLWRASNEIKKLTSYKNCQKIEIEDVKLLIKPKIETDIFKTIDALALKDKKRALKLLHRHLEKGDNPLYLLSMINFQFRNLLLVKELIEKNQPYYSILRRTQLNPFVFKKSYQQAQRFSPPELKKIYQKIFEVDLAIKTGRIEPETALDLLITEI